MPQCVLYQLYASPNRETVGSKEKHVFTAIYLTATYWETKLSLSEKCSCIVRNVAGSQRSRVI